MKIRYYLLFLLLAVTMCYGVDLFKEQYQWPTVGISILVRNKEASLPHFLTGLQQVDYPKDRLYIWKGGADHPLATLIPLTCFVCVGGRRERAQQPMVIKIYLPMGFGIDNSRASTTPRSVFSLVSPVFCRSYNSEPARCSRIFKMRPSILYLLLTVSVLAFCKNQADPWPTIAVAIPVRNKQLTLPIFLNLLDNMDYPKDQMHLWIHSDYNEDSSIQILQEWAKNHSSKYRKFHMTLDRHTEGKKLPDQTHYSEWSPQRYQHIIKLREKALNLAKDSWADYIFMLDADVFLTNPGTLKLLVEKDRQVVAPMLLTDGLYSNFWAGMTPKYYYQRTKNYEDIIRRKEVGCFNVPMVHSAVLISLRQGNTDLLTYDPKKVLNYDGPHDDIITFALSARRNLINLTVCNDEVYGFLPIPVEDEFNSETEQIDNLKLEALGRGIDLPIDPSMVKYIKLPKKTKYNLDEIFLINLEKRPERKNLMMKSFDTLGMDAKVIKAVDGKTLNTDDLRELSITLLPNYEDPYHKRPMKAGEIGCFLSHYNVWTEIARRHLPKSLILEDDVHFVPYFHERFDILMKELDKLDWDLVYIGRKVLLDRKEKFAEKHIVTPLYSYWTLGYLLSEAGARKLINAEPLAKMLPVDEFLPIMFDQHPNGTWKSMFPNRDLKAYSASPLLVHPTHYTGEPGYVSDTEDSPIAQRPKANTSESIRRYLNEL